MGASSGRIYTRIVIDALVNLASKLIRLPDTEECGAIAAGFQDLRQGESLLSNVCGAIDGTFIFCMAPAAGKPSFTGYKSCTACVVL